MLILIGQSLRLQDWVPVYFTSLISIQSPVRYNVKLIIGKTGRERRNRS
jgi:hypothetical protein